MDKETNKYIAKLQESNKLVDSIRTKINFITLGKLSNCEETAIPSISGLDREIGYVLNNLKELDSSIII